MGTPGEEIKVAVRVRNLLDREKNSSKLWKVGGQDSISNAKDSSKKYVFDRVFNETENNEKVYADIGFSLSKPP